MRQSGFLGYWGGTTLKPKGDDVRKEVKFRDCYIDPDDAVALEKMHNEQVQVIVLPAQMGLADLDATIDKLLRQRDQVVRDTSWAQKAPPREDQAQQTIDGLDRGKTLAAIRADHETPAGESEAEPELSDYGKELKGAAESELREMLADRGRAEASGVSSGNEDQGDEHRVEGVSREPLVSTTEEHLAGMKCPNCDAHFPVLIPAGEGRASRDCPFCGATVTAAKADGRVPADEPSAAGDRGDERKEAAPSAQDAPHSASEALGVGDEGRGGGKVGGAVQDASGGLQNESAALGPSEVPAPQLVTEDHEGTGLPLYDAGEAPGLSGTENGSVEYVRRMARLHGYAEVLFQVRPLGTDRPLVYHWTPGEPGRPNDAGKLERLPKHALRALISRRRRAVAAGRSWADASTGQADEAASAATGA